MCLFLEYALNGNYRYIFRFSKVLLIESQEVRRVTSLRRRLDNVLSELETIREALSTSLEYPACCLIFHSDGKISCDAKGPLEEKEFLKECKRCRAVIKEILDNALTEEES